jgi:hypothetical protein
MSVKVSVIDGGSNNVTTAASDVLNALYQTMTPGISPKGTIVDAAPNTGDFAVQAQSSPNKTVKIKAGVCFVLATPTGGVERLYPVTLSADYDLTIPDNTTGSTRYDKILLYLPAASLANAPTGGDLTEAVTIITERHTAAGEAITAINAIELAEITLANGFTTIANSNIAESRMFSTPLRSSGIGGWTNPSERWVYASATTITVPSGAASHYSVGDKVKLKQGGTQKYFYITAVADTTLTITGGADYTLTNAPILENYYSKTSPVVGFPGSFSWVPTFTGFTASIPSGYVARFSVSGRMVYLSYVGGVGPGTSNATTFTISLPITSAANPYQGMCAVRDNSVLQTVPGQWAANPSTPTVLTIYKDAGPTGTFTNSGTKDAQLTAFYEI